MRDVVGDRYGHGFMDRFHDYPWPESLWRYQHRARVSFIHAEILIHANPNAVALDAGAGKGPYTYLLAKHFGKVYSFEYCPDEIQRLRDNILKEYGAPASNVEIEQVDLQSNPLADESVQFIVCSEVLEHIPDFSSAMGELRRVCSPGGRVVISMPNKLSLFWQCQRFSHHAVRVVRAMRGAELLSRGGYGDWELSRHWQFSPRKIRHIAKSAGFRIVAVRGLSTLTYNEGLNKFLCRTGLFSLVDWLDTWVGRLLPGLGASYFLILARD